jgi:hypothetical protein
MSPSGIRARARSRFPVLLATVLAASCGSVERNPSGPETSHPRTRTEVFDMRLGPGGGIGYEIRVPKAGTLVARLRWDEPDVRLAIFLCDPGPAGCDPPLAVGALHDSTTQELVSLVEEARYMVFVRSPPGASAPTSYVLSVTYPLL